MHFENLLFILLIAMAALLRLLATKAGNAKKGPQKVDQGPTITPKIGESIRTKNAFANFSKRSGSRRRRNRLRRLCRAQIFRRDLWHRCNLRPFRVLATFSP